jgi:hypothetical protein
MTEWKYQQSDVQNGLWWRYIEHSGLLSLVHNSYRTVSRVIIVAFVERWYLETNTFHMPFEEMTITLYDVNTLLVILAVGKTIFLSQADEAQTLLSRAL